MPGLEHGFGFLHYYSLMSDGVASEQVKKFFFTSGRATATSSSRADKDEDEEPADDESLEVFIPEVSEGRQRRQD